MKLVETNQLTLQSSFFLFRYLCEDALLFFSSLDVTAIYCEQTLNQTWRDYLVIKEILPNQK